MYFATEEEDEEAFQDLSGQNRIFSASINSLLSFALSVYHYVHLSIYIFIYLSIPLAATLLLLHLGWQWKGNRDCKININSLVLQ